MRPKENIEDSKGKHWMQNLVRIGNPFPRGEMERILEILEFPGPLELK
jgi:hypothetical protein